MERTETQEISVVNGTAKTPSFESINEIFAIRGAPVHTTPQPNRPTHAASRELAHEEELQRFLKGMPDD